MRTVCQITMFRATNYGSALQVYALHTVLEHKLGWHCLTIDYVKQKQDDWRVIRGLVDVFWWLASSIVGFRKEWAYARFLRKELNLTRPYASYEEMVADPPKADVYMTGSDQTFNPRWARGDKAYLLGFVPKQSHPAIRKLSYASSFAVPAIPEAMKPLYRAMLSEYDAISVRETTGLAIVRELLGKEAVCCCDPTILLPKSHWEKLARKASRRPKRPYILVYNVYYMVNPYPEADRIVKELQDALGLEVIYLQGRRYDVGRPNSHVLKGTTHYEFVDLFLNASFILTSSFHGVVFALHSEKPFIALAAEDPMRDTRIRALLERVGATRHLVPVPIPDTFHVGDPKRFDPTLEGGYSGKLETFRAESLAWLTRALEGERTAGSGLAAVGGRGDAFGAAEEAPKVLGVLEAEAVGDLGDGVG